MNLCHSGYSLIRFNIVACLFLRVSGFCYRFKSFEIILDVPKSRPVPLGWMGPSFKLYIFSSILFLVQEVGALA